MLITLNFYSWFVVYFLIINIVNTKQRFYLFMMIFLLCVAKISIGTSKNWAMRGFSFTSWGLTGPPGYFQNSGELSILMLTLFPVAYKFYEFFKERVSRWERALLVLFWVTPILTILGASSRGSQLALAIQLTVMFRKYVFKFKSLLIIVMFGFAFFHLLPEEQKARFQSAGDDKTSTQRLLYWENGWEMVQNHPWLGVGYFNFPRYFETHYPEDMLYDRAELPHNIIIQVGTDAGFLGLIPFCFLLLLPYFPNRKLVKVRKTEPFLSKSLEGMKYGIFGFVLAGQFVTVAYYPFLWISLAFVVSINNISKKLVQTINK